VEISCLSAAEIAAALSWREFESICTYFDLKALERRGCCGPLRPAPFEIVYVERTPYRVQVTARDDRGMHLLAWAGKVIPFRKK